MAGATAVETVRPPFWRNIRVLRVLGQVLFVVLLVLAGRELFQNLQAGVERQGIDLSYDLLQQRAGFDIKESFIIDYNPNLTVFRAYATGAMNTVFVALIGILLATVLGLVMGVARLSPNWLVRKIAQVYVEIFRNTPVLVIIIFVYVGIILALPVIGGGSIFDVGFISNRGTAIPWFRTEEGAGIWGAFLLGGLLAAVLVWRRRTRVNERTGQPHHRVLWSLGVLAVVAVVGFLISGTPLRADVPEIAGRVYAGGIQVSGEYTGLLLALVIYTSAFIAEIVRGSILAVDKGQKEAAQAMGLTPFQQLRHVVLPQAMRIAIPPINSQYQNLTKNSSLAIAAAYPELVSVSNTIINQKGRATQMLILIMLTYLSMTLFISLIMNILNRMVAYRGARR